MRARALHQFYRPKAAMARLPASVADVFPVDPADPEVVWCDVREVLEVVITAAAHTTQCTHGLAAAAASRATFDHLRRATTR